MKCTLSDWGCVYHACLTDDCQKQIVISQGFSLGNSKCDNNNPEPKISKQVSNNSKNDNL